MSTPSTVSAKNVKVSLEYHIPEKMPVYFANQVTVQVLEGVCRLTFFDAFPPVIAGTPEEMSAAIEKLGSVRAVGMASIVLPNTKASEFARLLQELDLQVQAHEGADSQVMEKTPPAPTEAEK